MKFAPLFLVFSLVGCVSTSRYEAETDVLREELKQEKAKLAKTQLAVCGLGVQLCTLTTVLQVAAAGESVDVELIHSACAEQAGSCVQSLKSPK
jgi:hypothetical protein